MVIKKLQPKPKTMEAKIAIVLGAGASRGVSYAHLGKARSPLDADFFDLLQRLDNPLRQDRESIDFILEKVKNLPHDHWRSFERTFYTLHMGAYLSKKLGITSSADEENTIVSNFTRSIQALLRKAHGTEICDYHSRLLKRLDNQDVIISFNYDLVAERALRGVATERGLPFDPDLYGLRSLAVLCSKDNKTNIP